MALPSEQEIAALRSSVQHIPDVILLASKKKMGKYLPYNFEEKFNKLVSQEDRSPPKRPSMKR